MPEVIILGRFPSRQLLQKKGYYGSPMNHFWHKNETSFSIDRHLPYGVRFSLLVGHRIVLWDGIFSCSANRVQMPGSGPVFNDLAGFLEAFPTSTSLLSTEAPAGRYYRQLNISASVPAVVLPSTSPANT